VARSYVAANDAARHELSSFVARLTEEQLAQPVGEHWTVSIALAHLAFLDRLWCAKYDEWERTGVVELPDLSLTTVGAMNDGMLPWWRSIAPSQATHEVLAAAGAVDRRAAALPQALVDAILAVRPRTLLRAMHRRETLAEINRALGG